MFSQFLWFRCDQKDYRKFFSKQALTADMAQFHWKQSTYGTAKVAGQ
jgi:hypothetical protein